MSQQLDSAPVASGSAAPRPSLFHCINMAYDSIRLIGGTDYNPIGASSLLRVRASDLRAAAAAARVASGSSSSAAIAYSPSAAPAAAAACEAASLFRLSSVFLTHVSTPNSSEMNECWAELRRDFDQPLPRESILCDDPHVIGVSAAAAAAVDPATPAQALASSSGSAGSGVASSAIGTAHGSGGASGSDELTEADFADGEAIMDEMARSTRGQRQQSGAGGSDRNALSADVLDQLIRVAKQAGQAKAEL